MAHIKNQNQFHLIDSTGKKTRCGLSNQFKDALSLDKFNRYLNDESWTKCCCKKCQNSIKS